MNQWQLCILKPGEKEVISNPSWDQIHSILDQLDGNNLDNVSILSDQAGDLMVAGGDEYNGKRLYYLSYYDDGYSEERLILLYQRWMKSTLTLQCKR
jgi:hypothetical protein